MHPAHLALATDHLALASRFVAIYLAKRPHLRRFEKHLIGESVFGLLRAASEHHAGRSGFARIAWQWMTHFTRKFMEEMATTGSIDTRTTQQVMKAKKAHKSKPQLLS